MSCCRPMGGRAAPRSIQLRTRAEDQMLDRIGKGQRKERATHRMTPEMRIGYLRRKLEELENDQAGLMQRKGKMVGPLLVVRSQIRDLQDEIVGIFTGIAEAQQSEPEYTVLGCEA